MTFSLAINSAHASYEQTIGEDSAYTAELYDGTTPYSTTFTLQEIDTDGSLVPTTYSVLLNTSTGTTTSLNDLILDYLNQASSSQGTNSSYSGITTSSTSGSFSINYTDENGTEQKLYLSVLDSNGNAITGTNNRTEVSTATSISENFISNSLISDSDAYGGAIYNTVAISSIKGDFIANYTESTANTTFSGGGAIYNASTIDYIEGDFIGNHTESASSTYALGGAIYNDSGTITSIVGNFISNSSSYNGGAIYNHSAIIGSITGDFVSNTAGNGGCYL